ncbi:MULTISPECIES: hypothetical protein [unclassified Serratia (in: enterobacteria)]|uniref:hypothetical protein n=1 Tax=unclassified Serratia (in: enterobacteria) TaxID=2647522 RepID=UPI003B434307
MAGDEEDERIIGMSAVLASVGMTFLLAMLGVWLCALRGAGIDDAQAHVTRVVREDARRVSVYAVSDLRCDTHVWVISTEGDVLTEGKTTVKISAIVMIALGSAVKNLDMTHLHSALGYRSP